MPHVVFSDEQLELLKELMVFYVERIFTASEEIARNCAHSKEVQTSQCVKFDEQTISQTLLKENDYRLSDAKDQIEFKPIPYQPVFRLNTQKHLTLDYRYADNPLAQVLCEQLNHKKIYEFTKDKLDWFFQVSLADTDAQWLLRSCGILHLIIKMLGYRDQSHAYVLAHYTMSQIDVKNNPKLTKRYEKLAAACASFSTIFEYGLGRSASNGMHGQMFSQVLQSLLDNAMQSGENNSEVYLLHSLKRLTELQESKVYYPPMLKNDAVFLANNVDKVKMARESVIEIKANLETMLKKILKLVAPSVPKFSDLSAKNRANAQVLRGYMALDSINAFLEHEQDHQLYLKDYIRIIHLLNEIAAEDYRRASYVSRWRNTVPVANAIMQGYYFFDNGSEKAKVNNKVKIKYKNYKQYDKQVKWRKKKKFKNLLAPVQEQSDLSRPFCSWPEVVVVWPEYHDFYRVHACFQNGSLEINESKAFGPYQDIRKDQVKGYGIMFEDNSANKYQRIETQAGEFSRHFSDKLFTRMENLLLQQRVRVRGLRFGKSKTEKLYARIRAKFKAPRMHRDLECMYEGINKILAQRDLDSLNKVMRVYLKELSAGNYNDADQRKKQRLVFAIAKLQKMKLLALDGLQRDYYTSYRYFDILGIKKIEDKYGCNVDSLKWEELQQILQKTFKLKERVELFEQIFWRVENEVRDRIIARQKEIKNSSVTLPVIDDLLQKCDQNYNKIRDELFNKIAEIFEKPNKTILKKEIDNELEQAKIALFIHAQNAAQTTLAAEQVIVTRAKGYATQLMQECSKFCQYVTNDKQFNFLTDAHMQQFKQKKQLDFQLTRHVKDCFTFVSQCNDRQAAIQALNVDEVDLSKFYMLPPGFVKPYFAILKMGFEKRFGKISDDELSLFGLSIVPDGNAAESSNMAKKRLLVADDVQIPAHMYTWLAELDEILKANEDKIDTIVAKLTEQNLWQTVFELLKKNKLDYPIFLEKLSVKDSVLHGKAVSVVQLVLQCEDQVTVLFNELRKKIAEGASVIEVKKYQEKAMQLIKDLKDAGSAGDDYFKKFELIFTTAVNSAEAAAKHQMGASKPDIWLSSNDAARESKSEPSAQTIIERCMEQFIGEIEKGNRASDGEGSQSENELLVEAFKKAVAYQLETIGVTLNKDHGLGRVLGKAVVKLEEKMGSGNKQTENKTLSESPPNITPREQKIQPIGKGMYHELPQPGAAAPVLSNGTRPGMG